MTAPGLRLPGMPTREGGGADVDYYVPDFRVEVEGKLLSPETHGDVLDLKVTLETNQISSFDLTLNNWDDEHLTFKYSDSEVLMLGNMVRVSLGYMGRMREVIHGPITGISPRFSESGALAVSISGKDSLEFLKGRKPAAEDRKKFVNMKDTDIAREIATRNHLGFEGDDSVSMIHEVIYQGDRDDAQFLIDRARRCDFDCFVTVDGASSRGRLHFVRPRDGRSGRTVRAYTFEWGRSLVSFAPQLSTEQQVSSVTVRGWDARTKTAIVGKASANDLSPSARGKAATGPSVVKKSLGDRQNLIVDRPVFSEREARELAISILRERATRFSTGHAQVIGIPDLVPGNMVKLCKLGKRFSGEYEVKRVVHSLGSSGFTTGIDVESEGCGGARS